MYSTIANSQFLQIFKPQFIECPIKSPVKLEFVESEPSKAVLNLQEALNNCFDKVEKKALGVTDHATEKKRFKNKLLVYVPAFVKEFQRPKVRIMKLQVARDSEA